MTRRRVHQMLNRRSNDHRARTKQRDKSADNVGRRDQLRYRVTAQYDDHAVALDGAEHVSPGNRGSMPDRLQCLGWRHLGSRPDDHNHTPGSNASRGWTHGTARSRRSRRVARHRQPGPRAARPRPREVRRPGRRFRLPRRRPLGCTDDRRVQDGPVALRHQLIDLVLDHLDRGPDQLDGLSEGDPCGPAPAVPTRRRQTCSASSGPGVGEPASRIRRCRPGLPA